MDTKTTQYYSVKATFAGTVRYVAIEARDAAHAIRRAVKSGATDVSCAGTVTGQGWCAVSQQFPLKVR